jgi:hypothetical protein
LKDKVYSNNLERKKNKKKTFVRKFQIFLQSIFKR